MLKKILGNQKIVLIIDILLILFAVKYSKYIFDFEMQKAVFASKLEQFSKENEIPTFRIGKIILYTSANAIDSSDGKLEDISVSQFTDIAIYIDNKTKFQENVAENTINELTIDEIKLTMNLEGGDYIFNYKNPKEFGKYLSLKNLENERIPFKVVSSNEEWRDVDYNNSVFYTDCSNPITLGFVNRNFITNGKVSDTSGQLSFDGSILGNANVDLESISGKIEMMIHIKNNLNEKFICNLVIDNDLTKDTENLLNGYSIQITEEAIEKYNFVKILEDKNT